MAFKVGDRVRVTHRAPYSFVPAEGEVCGIDARDPGLCFVRVPGANQTLGRGWVCRTDWLEPLAASQTADRVSPLPTPQPLPPCPSCGQPGAYVGLLTIECPNSQCMHYVPAAPAPTSSQAVEVRGGCPIDDLDTFQRSAGIRAIADFSKPLPELQNLALVDIRYFADGTWLYYGADGHNRLPAWAREAIQVWVYAQLAGRPDYTIDVP